MLAFSMEAPNAAAKLIKDFGKEYEQLAVQVIGVDDAVYSAESLDKIASFSKLLSSKAISIFLCKDFILLK